MLFSTLITACLATFVAAAPLPQTLSQLGDQAAGTVAASVAETANAAVAGFEATGHPGVAQLVGTLASSAANTAKADQAAAGLPIAGANPSSQVAAAGAAAAVGTAVNALGLNTPVNAAASSVASDIAKASSTPSMAAMGMY